MLLKPFGSLYVCHALILAQRFHKLIGSPVHLPVFPAHVFFGLLHGGDQIIVRNLIVVQRRRSDDSTGILERIGFHDRCGFHLCLYGSRFSLDSMPQKSYNIGAKPTALPPETARRQSFVGTTTDNRQKRAIVFIDGSNWYHKLKKLLSAPRPGSTEPLRPPIDFDIRAFAENLVMPDPLVEIRYYIGKVRRIKGDVKSEELYGNQQRFLHFLQKQRIHVGFGHLISYPDGSFHEKGVDILLAVEMIRCVLEKKCEVAYLVSSDTDLVPAVDECKRLGGEVVYVGSSLHGQSFGLSKTCKRTVLLQPKDVLPFVPPKLPL